MAARTRGTGGYTPSEEHIVITSSTYDGGGHPVVVCHGGGDGGDQYEPAALRRDLNVLADTGLVVCAADLAGLHTWGNDAGTAAVTAMLAWLATNYDTDNSKVVFVADSHGALTAINWATRNPALTAAVVLRVPCVALDAAHDRNVGGFATTIEGCYGGLAPYNAALPTHDPSHPTMVAQQISLGLVPKMRAWYDTGDPIVLPAEVEGWAAATGTRLIPLSGTANHEPWSKVHARDQASWIWSRIEAA